MSFMEIGKIALGPQDDLIYWYQSKGLLTSSQTCHCGTGMAMVPRKDIADKFRYIISINIQFITKYIITKEKYIRIIKLQIIMNNNYK